MTEDLHGTGLGRLFFHCTALLLYHYHCGFWEWRFLGADIFALLFISFDVDVRRAYTRLGNSNRNVTMPYACHIILCCPSAVRGR